MCFKFAVVHLQRIAVFCYWSKIELVSSFPNPFSPTPFLLPLSFKRYNGLFFPQLHSWVKYFLLRDLVRKTLSSQFKSSLILILQYVLSLKDQKVLILWFLNSLHGCLHSVFTSETRILGLPNRITVVWG